MASYPGGKYLPHLLKVDDPNGKPEYATVFQDKMYFLNP
jgi:hypothetical protein